MRFALLLPLLIAANPAVARDRDDRASPLDGDMARVIGDPGLPDQMGQIAAAVTRAVMAIPVGEIEAAAKGRPASPADRQRTIGDRMGGDGMDRAIGRQVEQSTGKMQHQAQAMARALPAIERALTDAVAQIDRATANLPDPTYPRR